MRDTSFDIDLLISTRIPLPTAKNPTNQSCHSSVVSPLTCSTGDELAQVVGCPWTMRDSGSSLAQNRWQGELGLAVGQEDSGGGGVGISGGHLGMDPTSTHQMPSPMHLKLDQKEREAWDAEYMEELEREEMEEDGDEEEDEEEEVDFEEGEGWDEEEQEEEEEDGEEAEVEWEVPHMVPTTSLQEQNHHHQLQSPLDDHDNNQAEPEARDFPIVPIQSRLNGLRQRRLRRWRKLHSHEGLRLRLTQHWKTWRHRAQWVGTLGHRRARSWRRYSWYSNRQRRGVDPGLSSPLSDDERLVGSERGEMIPWKVYLIN